MKVINLSEKFSLFHDHWHPRIIGELNGQQVKIAKVQGDFIWHSHENEDELFFIVEGKLWLDFRDKTVELNPGEMIIVPRGVEHRPRAEGERDRGSLRVPEDDRAGADPGVPGRVGHLEAVAETAVGGRGVIEARGEGRLPDEAS